MDHGFMESWPPNCPSATVRIDFLSLDLKLQPLHLVPLLAATKVGNRRTSQHLVPTSGVIDRGKKTFDIDCDCDCDCIHTVPLRYVRHSQQARPRGRRGTSRTVINTNPLFSPSQAGRIRWFGLSNPCFALCILQSLPGVGTICFVVGRDDGRGEP
jgi:hypothetical protein